MPPRFAPLLAALAAVGCRTATVVDLCDIDPAQCLSCTSDDACAFTGNPCEATVYCAHEDATVTVTQIGCSAATEYAWPAAAECHCAGVCTALDGG